MLGYMLRILQRQYWRSILTSSGFFVAACSLILLNATTQSTILQTKQIISQNWRPTYDLVVIPLHKSVAYGKAIPLDNFEGYDGGISIQQYQQIKSLPGVAIAAPIAFISYASFPTSAIQFGPQHPQPGFYQLDWTLTAFNGKQHIVEFHNRVRTYASSASCEGYLCDPSISTQQQSTLNSIGIDDYFFTRNGGYFTGVPNPGTFLLAAIDPQAENQLLHLDKSIVAGSSLSPQNTLTLNEDHPSLSGNTINDKVPNYDVPLLINTQRSGQIALHASFVRLETSVTDPRKILANGGNTYLDSLPQKTVFSGNVPIAQNDLKLFSKGAELSQNGTSLGIKDTGTPSFSLNFTSAPSNLSYKPITSSPEGKNTAYTLIPNNSQLINGIQEPEIAFRPLTPLPGDIEQVQGTLGYNYQTTFYTIYNRASYTAQPVGQFDGSRLSADITNTLNWLPENTYTSSPTRLRYDAQGHPIGSTNILPTTNPAGFMLQPPLALTTLTAAQQIRGKDCINVIRIRASGNISPDDNGWNRVAQLAQLIQQRTGLKAIVTLGSTPKPTLIYVPGLKTEQAGILQNIDPIGWVEEQWIFIGAGILYLDKSKETQFLLLGSILPVCFGYLIVTLSSLVSSQRRESALLSALGWQPGHAIKLFLSQALILALGGSVSGIGFAILITSLLEINPPWQIVVWTLPIVLALALLSALYPLWQIGRIRPAEVLRAGSTISSDSEKGWLARILARLPAMSSFALRNLARSRIRSLIAIGSLFLSAVLLTVMVDGLLAFRETLQGTLLGNYVLLQTAIPQLAGAFFAVLLTFLSVADLLLLQVRERQREIGLLQAIGWRPGIVQRLFVQEGLTLALVGTIPGVLLAVGILLARHATQQIVPLPLVGLGAVLLMVAVATLATLPALRAANQMQLTDVLRIE